MKLWDVEVSASVVVAAETREEAEQIVADLAWRNDLEVEWDTHGTQISTKGSVPYGWDHQCLIYGTEDDVTVGEALEKWGDPKAQADEDASREEMKRLRDKILAEREG